MKFVIDSFIKSQLSRIAKFNHQKPSYGHLNASVDNITYGEQNELKELFVNCVNEAKFEYLKRNKDKQGLTYQDTINVSKLTKYDKIKIISKMLLNTRFLQLIKCQMFSEKCCDNQNCLFNAQHPRNPPLEDDSGNQSVSKIDLKLNQILSSDPDLSMNQNLLSQTGQGSIMADRIQKNSIDNTMYSGTKLGHSAQKRLVNANA